MRPGLIHRLIKYILQKSSSNENIKKSIGLEYELNKNDLNFGKYWKYLEDR